MFRPIQQPVFKPIVQAINAVLSGGLLPFQQLPPSGFGWSPPVKIFNNAGTYYTDYDPTPFLVEGAPGVTTYYVDGDTGNDGNPGTSVSPKKSITALTGGRVNKLLIKARGTFYRNTIGYIQTAHDNLCIEAWGGAACIFTTEADPTSSWSWVDQGGGQWAATLLGGINANATVYAGTAVDSLTRLTIASSIANCLATAGSYYVDFGGNKLYVRTTAGTSPATGHTVYGTNGSCNSVNFASFAYDQKIQFVGLSFRGGDAAYALLGDSAYVKRLECVNCDFKRATNFGAFHSSGNSTVILYGCTAGPSVFDGFSYSTASGSVGGNVPYAMEINCIGRNNGLISTGANQGSTTHFTGKLVRVNGQYYNNADDQIADVGANTRSWNLGCTLGPKGAGSSKSGAQAGNDGTDIRMWFDGCTFTGLDYGWGAASGATIYYKNLTAPSTNPASTGTITTY